MYPNLSLIRYVMLYGPDSVVVSSSDYNLWYSISWMMKFFKNKAVIAGLISLVVLIVVFGINQIFILRQAHSTFENYYAFRGCTQLLLKSQDYGICKTDKGQAVKIVKFQGKWYLDGDLPFCIASICL